LFSLSLDQGVSILGYDPLPASEDRDQMVWHLIAEKKPRRVQGFAVSEPRIRALSESPLGNLRLCNHRLPESRSLTVEIRF
jgi:hypothetical protein